MDIGGKPVEAELFPADQARKIYEDIVRKLKDPALLEYADRDVFKVRVFPSSRAATSASPFPIRKCSSRTRGWSAMFIR